MPHEIGDASDNDTADARRYLDGATDAISSVEETVGGGLGCIRQVALYFIHPLDGIDPSF